VDAALKEWAAIVEALENGVQTALLRKGGIVEAARDGFHVRHQRFLLYPTHEHQHARLLREPYNDWGGPGVAGELRLRVLAEVAGVYRAPEDRSVLLAMEDEFIWNADFVHQRYDYRPDLPLWILLLRVYRIPEVVVPERGSYAGCKSWVNLTEDVAVGGAAVVLPDADFAVRQARYQSL
jgi:hypothetical protein